MIKLNLSNLRFVLFLFLSCVNVVYSASDEADLLKRAIQRYNNGDKSALSDIAENAKKVNRIVLAYQFDSLKLAESDESINFLKSMIPSLPRDLKVVPINRMARFKKREIKALASLAMEGILNSSDSDPYITNVCLSALVSSGDPGAVQALTRYCLQSTGNDRIASLAMIKTLSADVYDDVIKQISVNNLIDFKEIKNRLNSPLPSAIQKLEKVKLQPILDKLKSDQVLSSDDYQMIALFAPDPIVINAVKKRFLYEKDMKVKGNLMAILMQFCIRTEMLEVLKESGPIDDTQINTVIQAYKDGSIGHK